LPGDIAPTPPASETSPKMDGRVEHGHDETGVGGRMGPEDDPPYADENPNSPRKEPYLSAYEVKPGYDDHFPGVIRFFREEPLVKQTTTRSILPSRI